MSVNMNFTVGIAEDGSLTISLVPSAPVGGWSVRYQEFRRLGGSGLTPKYSASGLDGASGMSVQSSGAGVWRIPLSPADYSGRDPGAYPFQLYRTDSGSATKLAEGYRVVNL